MTPPGADVRIRWRLVDDRPAAIEAAARGIAETVVGHLQRKFDGEEVTTVRPKADRGWTTAQSDQPLGYREAQERLAGVQWHAVDGGTLLLITESGEILTRKDRARGRSRSTNQGMSETTPERRPVKIRVRPGQGGLKRQPPLSDDEEELRSYGEIVWRAVPGGGMLGVLELDPDGNTAIDARLSGDDKAENLASQVRGSLALASHFSERLRPRVAILAKNMTGTEVREVRHPRAGAPPPGVLERDDILLIDEYIEAGWLEHVIFHEPTRIARHPLPGEMIFERLIRNDVGLWIAWYGKQIDWAEDGDRLRNDMVFSKRDRDNIVRKLQTAHANKGALAGNGHLGATTFGVIRDRRTRKRYEDPEQMRWINRAFEIADVGLADDDRGLSIRRVRDALAEEGCEWGYERVRKLLRDPLYATGENTTRLRGIVIEQEPIPFENPVPLDRFLRVQEKLELRQGADRETPIGEYLFNYVDVRHLQCIDEINSRGLPPRIKGWVSREIKSHRLRHAYFTPPQCKSGGRGRGGCFTWGRDELEAPVVRELRKLATHPELLRQIAAATRHTLAPSEVRLSAAERAEIEREIQQLELDKEAATEQWVLGVAGGRQLTDGEKGFANYQRFIDTYDRQIVQRQRRLERDTAARTAGGKKRDPRQKERVDAFLEIMSIETPDDPDLRELRARLFQKIVSRIIIDDDGSGPITLTIDGLLVPEDAPLEQGNPILATADLLDAYADKKNGRTPAAEALIEAAEALPLIETDHSASAERSVSRLYSDYEKRPTTEALDRAQRDRLGATQWRRRRAHSRAAGIAAWSLTVHV